MGSPRVKYLGRGKDQTAINPPENLPLARRDKEVKLSQTPGKAKGGTCVTTPERKIMARKNRSYKRPDYWTGCRDENCPHCKRYGR